MKFVASRVLAAALVLGTAVGLSAQAPGDLRTARALYASADFEAALVELDAIAAPSDPVQRAELRALCYLGLGRQNDAERALEEIVRVNPRHEMSPADMPPRIVSLFDDVRRRTLPAVASDLLREAQRLYDRERYGEASARLSQLLDITSDEALVPPGARLADLRTVAAGLQQLVAEALASDGSLALEGTFSLADRDVVGPVEISRPEPLWTPSAGQIVPMATHQGVVEVIINEQGRVESAVMRRSVHPTYDPVYLEWTKEWRFDPASLDGRPVRYRRLFEVIVHPRRSNSGGR